MSRYFSPSEFECKCCGTEIMEDYFIDVLNQVREAVGRPFIITSGYRCPGHNERVSSTGRNGPHTTGMAVDIRADGRLKFDIIEAARSHGITRIGVAKSFIHLDTAVGERFTKRVVWAY